MSIELLDDVPKRGSQRRKIMDFIYSLRKQPYTLGDYTDRDITLQERQVKVIGNYEVTYWLDAPVNIVMVVGIHRADL